MKSVLRMLIFSAVALLATYAWNKGIVIQVNLQTIALAALIIAILYYLIRPLIKLIFLPVNFFTFGIVSFIANLVLFAFLTSYLHVFTITGWTFAGLNLGLFTLPKVAISYWVNVALVSLSISLIINSLETFI